MASIASSRLKQLILALLTTIRENEGFATKTKLLKLLYIADIEHYRDARETLTGFRWIFHLYGPWAESYEPLLDQMQAEGSIAINPGTRSDLDTQFVEAREEAGLDGLGLSLGAELAIRELGKIWAVEPTGELLNYVYFSTEPMRCAERGRRLDFANVRPREKVPFYRRSRSGTAQKVVKKFRQRLLESLAASRAEIPAQSFESLAPLQACAIRKAETIGFTPPRCDDEFLTALSALEKEAE